MPFVYKAELLLEMICINLKGHLKRLTWGDTICRMKSIMHPFNLLYLCRSTLLSQVSTKDCGLFLINIQKIDMKRCPGLLLLILKDIPVCHYSLVASQSPNINSSENLLIYIKLVSSTLSCVQMPFNIHASWAKPVKNILISKKITINKLLQDAKTLMSWDCRFRDLIEEGWTASNWRKQDCSLT